MGSGAIPALVPPVFTSAHLKTGVTPLSLLCLNTGAVYAVCSMLELHFSIFLGVNSDTTVGRFLVLTWFAFFL